MQTPLPPPSFSNPLVHAARSAVHGRGVFASTRIKRGTRIADYYGVEIPYAAFRARYGNDWHYAYKGRNYFAIVAKRPPYLTGNVTNYVNEGARPNVELRERALFAARDIRPGAELLLAYHRSYPRDVNGAPA